MSNTNAQNTGFGSDTIRNIENVSGGSGNDNITGNGNDNILKGGDGADVIRGGNGADTINGGGGGDTLYAGSDSSIDTFVYESISDAGTYGTSPNDKIYEFNRNHDKIDLSAIDGNNSSGGHQSLTFENSNIGNCVWCEDIGSDVVFYVNVSSSTGGTYTGFSICLDSVGSVLTSDNFVL